MEEEAMAFNRITPRERRKCLRAAPRRHFLLSRGVILLNAMASSSIAPTLARRTAPAAPELVERLEDGRLRCYSCGHRCPIPEGREGVCRVRYNEGGVLKVPWGYVGAL